MRQATLKFKNYARSVNIVDNSNLEARVFHFILSSLGVLALLYVLLLGNMVSNIVQRRALETNARALSNEVGDLELTYLSLSSNVDLPFSYSLGFKETKASFATRKSLGFQSNIKISQNEL